MSPLKQTFRAIKAAPRNLRCWLRSFQGTFTTYQTGGPGQQNRFHWRFTSPQGEVLATSSGFGSPQRRDRSMRTMRRSVTFANLHVRDNKL